MPLFDGSTDAPVLTFEVDPGGLTTFTLDVSVLDGDNVLGPSPDWTAIPLSDVRQFSIRRGRSREDQSNDAGTLTVELNDNDGFYNPDNTSPANPYTTAGASWWASGLPCRLIATWDGINYPLFRGRLEEPVPSLGVQPLATLTFVDGIADASADLASYTPVAETTAQRANRVLDLIGWPSDLRNIVGSKALLADGETGSATAVLEECATAEVGRFYVDASGNMCLTDRADAVARTVELVLSDRGTAGTINFLSLTTSPGIKHIVNECTATNGTYTTTVTNTASRSATRMRRPISVSAPLALDADVETLASLLAYRRGTPSTRVEACELQAFGIGTAWPGLLGLDLGDGVQVQRAGTNGIGLDVVLAAEGIAHTISPRSWNVVLNTAPVDASGSAFTLDTSLLNGPDVLAA